MNPKALTVALAAFYFFPMSTWGQSNSAVKTLNSIQFADQWCNITGVFDGSCLINAITAVKNMGGGTVDARSLFTMTSTQQIEVGDHTNGTRVTLLLPPTGAWKFNITDGVSCGIRILNLSRLIGTTTGVGSGFSLEPFGSTTNMDSLVCTDTAPPGSGSYVEMSSFGLNYNGQTGAKFTSGLLHISKLYDGSQIGDIVVQTQATNSYGVLVNGACCGSGFYNLVVNAYSASGTIPFAVVDPASFGSANTSCINCSFGHPGPGKPNVLINQSASAALNNGAWNFYNLQGESEENSDLTTALFQVLSGNARVYGGRLFHLLASSTAYCFQVSNAPNTSLDVRGFECKSVDGTDLNAIINLISGQTVNTDANGNVPDYVSEISYRNGQIVNAKAAGGMPNNTVNSGSITIGNTQSLFGTNDQLIQMSPAGRSAWSILEDIGTLGFALSTFNTHPISIRPNRTETVRFLSGGGIAMTGTAATLSGCSYSGQVGGATAGKFISGTTGGCTVTITTGSRAPNGWSCYASDLTNNNLIRQSGSTATSCSISGTTTSGDTINWAAIAF